jgi:hypothetical protein
MNAPFLKYSIFVIGFLFFIQWSFGQEIKPSYVGVLVAGELQYRKVEPNFGLFYEKHFTPKSGIELGVFYRIDKRQNLIFIEEAGLSKTETITVRESYLYLPFLYRYSTRFAAFSIGPTVDFFSGWKQIDEKQIEVSNYTRTPSVEVGAFLKIGKEIPLKGSVLLEPELRMGFRSFNFPEGYIGMGVKLKRGLIPGK